MDLGPYEDKLREMLLSGDPGPAAYFPCVLTSYKRTGLPTGIISAPLKSRVDNGKTMYAFNIAGMLYIFRIVEDEQLDWVLEISLNENGDVRIPHASKESAAHFFNKILGGKVF